MIRTEIPAPPVAPPRGPAPPVAADLALCTVWAVPEAAARLRRFVRDVARRWALPEDAEEALTVIVTELGTNAVLHSGSPDLTLRLRRTGDVLVLEVEDRGEWLRRKTPRRDPLDGGGCCGRGLQLVSAYARHFRVRSTPGGTVARAELVIAPPASGAAFSG